MSQNVITIQSYRGADIIRFIPDLARLRLTVFREYPYLYDGTMAYETGYLETFATAPDTVVVIAFEGEQVIGASTGMPLAASYPEMQAPFLRQGIDIGQVFYLGESVLLPPCRGKGIGSRFFTEREAHAQALRRYTATAFCAVERLSSDPRRPADYRDLSPFWQKRGYTKRPDLHTTFHWKEIDEPDESPKAMAFWLRQLPPLN